MINILMPVAGQAKRFVDCGYQQPKPLIPVTGVPMIKLALQSLIKKDDISNYRLTFVVRDDHCAKFDINNTLRHLFKGWVVDTAIVDHVTQGTLCSCLIARPYINPKEPLIIYTPDVCFNSDFEIQRDFIDTDNDGMLLTFKANSPDHSYVAVDQNGVATKTAEKVVISNDAIVGVYGFRTGQMFLDCADHAIKTNLKTNNEFYVAPIYNKMINDGKRVGLYRVPQMYVLGTPEDLMFYETYVARYSPVLKIAVCCDHSGFALKEQLCVTLAKMGIECVDFGTYSNKDSDHYDSLKPCVEYLLTNSNVIGIGVCNTGQGFNIAANKVKGIRSALVTNSWSAEMGRRHNAANFFALPASLVSSSHLEHIVSAIVNNCFDGGRHATRIRRISNDPLFSS